MPTGYTYDIYEGKEITAKEFIMRCARAFGVLYSMRDEPLDAPIPEKFETNDYYLRKLKETEEELKKIESMTDEEIQNIIDEEYKKTIERNKEQYSKLISIKEKYEKILSEVEKWEPLTEDHKNLKKFCIRQLEDSIRFDCGDRELNFYLKPVEKKDVQTWKQEKINSLKKDIEYYVKEWDEEIKRTNERNEWLKKLRESLENFD